MKSLEEVRRIKQQVEQGLLRRPGVTGVGVGYQTIDGQKTTIPAILVYVSDPSAVAPELPISIDGVPVEVIAATIKPSSD